MQWVLFAKAVIGGKRDGRQAVLDQPVGISFWAVGCIYKAFGGWSAIGKAFIKVILSTAPNRGLMVANPIFINLMTQPFNLEN